MIWLVLEILLGLALFALIVWWTLPRKRPAERSGERDRGDQP
jgi:hypothetical protein